MDCIAIKLRRSSSTLKKCFSETALLGLGKWSGSKQNRIGKGYHPKQVKKRYRVLNLPIGLKLLLNDISFVMKTSNIFAMNE